MKVKAAVLYKLNKPLVIEEVKISPLGRGQVLVKILYTGICHTQINEMKGIKGPDNYLPHTLGHEASGIVKGIGQGVTKVKKGDYVVLHWMKGSGLDAPSAQYLMGNEKINSGAITTFNEYSIISENRMTKITRDVPADVASIIGCAVLTGSGIVKNNLKTKPENTLAVFGVGGLGTCAVLLANALGCKKIIAIDIQDKKLKLAKECGATDIINATREDPATKIREITNGQGVDQAAETSGIKSVVETAFESIKYGGTLVFASNIRKGEKICLDPWGLINGKNIFGTFGGAAKPDEDIPYYVDLYLKEKLKIKKLLTHQYKLEEVNQAFEDIEKGKVGRALIKM